MAGYLTNSLTTQLLEARSKSYLTKCVEIIRNEKIAFAQLFNLKLTDKVIALVSGLDYNTITHLNKLTEETLKKHYNILRKCDFGKFVERTIRDSRKKI